MHKELKDPRKHDGSFDLEVDDADSLRSPSGRPKPGKRTAIESLPEVLEALAGAPAGEERERLGARYLGRRGAGGASLEPSLATEFGRHLGFDLTGVRVHTDRETSAIAEALGVAAFTFGRDIFFSSGLYRPGTRGGRKLIAHEVAHVAQHQGLAPRGRVTIGSSGDAHERDADRVAARIVRGQRATPRPAAPAVRFSREGASAFDEQDEMVGDGNTPIGCGQGDWQEIRALIANKSESELIDLYRGCHARARPVLQAAIKTLPLSSEAKNRILADDRDNPTPARTDEVEGLGEARTAIEQESEKAGVEEPGVQPGEERRVQTVSASSGESESIHEAPPGAGANDTGALRTLSSADEQAALRELSQHEVFVAMGRAAVGGVEEMVSDPANLMDLSITATVHLFSQMRRYTRVSQIVSGAHAVYNLMTRDWERTLERMSSWGEGATEYERLANNISVVSEAVDVILDIMRALAGGLALVSGGLWLASFATAGATAPLATALTAAAIGVTTAAGILGMIRNTILVPTELCFRELDRMQRQADPSAVDEQATSLEEGARSITAALAPLGLARASGAPAEAVSGTARAGTGTRNPEVSRSPADLPEVAIPVSSFESAPGPGATVESDAVGPGARGAAAGGDPQVRPGSEVGARPMAVTEGQPTMDGGGRPQPDPRAAATREPEGPVGDSGGGEVRAERAGRRAPIERRAEREPAAEGESRADREPRDRDRRSMRDVDPGSLSDSSDRQLAARYAEGRPRSAPRVRVERVAGDHEHPPTTVEFLQRLERTIAMLESMEAETSQPVRAVELAGPSERALRRASGARTEVDRRRDAHRGQLTRAERATGLVGQGRSELPRLQRAIGVIGQIRGVASLGSRLPGRLGRGIAARVAEVERAESSFEFVSRQMDGQQQEMASVQADQEVKGHTLEAAGDRINSAQEQLAAADQMARQHGNVDAGAYADGQVQIRAQKAEYVATYNRLSGALTAWTTRSAARRATVA